MGKKCILVFCIVIIGLPFHSCGMPERVQIQGTLDLPVTTGSNNWGIPFAKRLEDNFETTDGEIPTDFFVRIYDVNYGQREQTFLIHIHDKITEKLSPDDYLKKVKALLKRGDTEEEVVISEKIDISAIAEKELLSLTIPPGTIVPGTMFPFPVDFSVPNIGMDEVFLHTLIEEGYLNIELKSDDPNFNKNLITITPAILVTQGDSAYSGTVFSGLDQFVSASSESLRGKHLNNAPLKAVGIVGLNCTAAIPAAVKLVVSIKINKLESISLKFAEGEGGIRDRLNEDLNPVPLKAVSEYVTYMRYERFDEKNPDTTGIGTRFRFTDVIDGLEMNIGCDVLEFKAQEEAGAFQKLEADKDIVFANERNGILWLAGNNQPSQVNYPLFGGQICEELDFRLSLRPVGGGDILTIKPAGGITPGELKIEGEASFFQNWSEAEIQLAKLMRSYNDNGIIKGQIPYQEADRLSLAALNDTLLGFTFDGKENHKWPLVPAKLYLTGPVGILEGELLRYLSDYKIRANYGDQQWDTLIEKGHVNVEENSILIDDLIDIYGSYTRDDIPDGGQVFEFRDILNARPDDLRFFYEVGNMEGRELLIVTPDMFTDTPNQEPKNGISMNVKLLLPMSMTGPGTIFFPKVSEDERDLFGRTDLKNSLFTSLDADYVRLHVEFMGTYFQHGFLFIDKEKEIEEPGVRQYLFPDGIPMDGSTASADIDGDAYEWLKDNFIIPDYRMKFTDNAKVYLPRQHLGISSMKLELKGTAGLKLLEF